MESLGLKEFIKKFKIKFDRSDNQKNTLFISLGITFWKHNHYTGKHYHLIIDFLLWYLQITFGEENEK